MDPELIAYLGEQFGQINGRLERLEDATRRNEKAIRQTDIKVEGLHDQIRRTDIKVEGLRDEIRLVAEGVANNNEKLDAFREEVERKFDETRSLICRSYDDLDQRVRKLEARTKTA